MPGIADLFYLGQPNPTMQLASALNPTANPLTAGAPGGGPPSQGAGAPAPSPGGPPQPPQPQAYQSPPDLSQAYSQLADPNSLMKLYVQLSQRQQAQEGINRGIGMMLAGLAKPQDRGLMLQGSMGLSGPPVGEQMNDLLRMYQFQYQQQQQAALMRAVPDIAKQFGMTPDEVMAAGPDGIRTMLTTMAGAAGDPSVQQMNQSRRAYIDQHAVRDDQGNVQRDPATGQVKLDQPIPPELLSVDQFKAAEAGKVATAQQRQKDIAADKANFTPALDAYDKILADVDKLKSMPGLNEIIGPMGQFKTPMLLSQDGKNALTLYNKIMAEQYAAGVQDFKGAGRITQQELKQDAPSQSVMGNRNTDLQSFTQGIGDYEDYIRNKRAQVFGMAGQLNSPNLSDADYAKVNSIYKPGGDLFVPGQAQRRQASQPAPANAQQAGGVKQLSDSDLAEAKAKIAQYGKDAVIAHLKANGYDTSGLE
jgi:hypothetical protein